MLFKNGFYDELEELKTEIPEASFGFLENTDVTSESNAFSFLHGCCDEFAAMLSEMYGYKIECVRNAEGRLIHAYCITEFNGEKAYIDVRGTTTNPVLFYEDFENELTYYAPTDEILVIDEEGYEVNARIEVSQNKDELFEGEYEGWTDEEIKTFIREQKSFYNPNNVRESIFAKQLFFHVTLMKNVESIREQGLIPQIGERSEQFGENENNIYLFTSHEAMDNALMNWLGEWYNENYGEDVVLAVLKILLPPEITVIDEGVGYEVICRERIPAEHIEFFDESGKAIGIPLYRYELYCNGESQNIGFLEGIDDIGLSIEREERILRPFDEELTDPSHPQMCHSVSFFTERGNEKFYDAICDVIKAYEGSPFEVKLVSVKLPPYMLGKAIYKDEFQVCLPKELYKEEIAAIKEICAPTLDRAFKIIKPAEIGSLYHVGTMDINKKSNFSLEGNGLSVSNCPDSWCRITEGATHGDYYLLSKPDMKLLDFYSLTNEDKNNIQEWAIEEGYVVPGVLYKYSYCNENEEECFSLFGSYEEALMEADGENTYVEELEGLLPTKRLLDESMVKVDFLNVIDFITSLYAEKVLNYDGVYWDETLDEAMYSAPRGVIFNSKLSSFDVKNITTNKDKSLEQKIQDAVKERKNTCATEFVNKEYKERT